MLLAIEATEIREIYLVHFFNKGLGSGEPEPNLRPGNPNP